MRHRMKRIRWPALVAVGVLIAGSGTAYAVSSDTPAGNYRTVRATKGDLEQVLSTGGTVDAAHRADLEFGASGTVASVKVALGDTVKAGQVIATLDREALDAAVTRAKASLARAIAQLESDEDAQADIVADSSSSTGSSNKPRDSATPSESLSDGGDSDTTPDDDAQTQAALAALKQQQQAVIQAQSAASAALTAAKDALAAQSEACKDAYQDQPAGAPGPSGDTADDTTAKAPEKDAATDNAACSAALAAVQARQDDVNDAQDALAAALSALGTTLSDAVTALSSQHGGADTPSGSSTPSSSDDSSSDSSQSATSGDSDAPAADDSDSGSTSAARLAADQAAIEQARAELVDARQQLAQAVLRSTRSGTVRSLDLRKGDRISAGDVVAVVVGGRAVTIEATVPETKIGQVKVGQPVRVSTPGESGSANGTVTAIGLVADSSSGTASYPVTVTVEDPAIALPTGSQALLAIVVATAEDVVTVPLSAVSRQGDRSIVQTWNGTKLSNQAVTVGAVGGREVEITDGLEAGDEVVVADIDEDITGASDTINDRGGFDRGPVFRMGGPGGAGGGPVNFKSGG